MKVRTKMRPWEELDVDEAEYTDLKRQGLLLDEPKKTEPAKTDPKK
ncbi:hypothetical protein [Streptomyces griseoaurantiacus]|uniref:Uncharacterized protein n=1 Tax=Streptomyces griseoaurantiacus TaxID=68213 RepID=A0A7W2HUJ5_9ACTN|nr:hypothetical protein [Streptomyces griseoaurantiacus]MBA5222220.1 hypothetical protein [Streptomyces griseoaurantiacus]